MSEVTNETGSISEEEKIKLKNLPAMVYYGVNTDEAILMRMNNVPRSISNHIGKQFLENKPENLYDSKSKDIISWLKDLGDNAWKPETSTNITGSDYKQIWKTISGVD